MKILAALILSLITVAALAEGGDVPMPQSVQDDGLAVMTALLLAKPADLKQFKAAGDTVTGASIQAISPGVNEYTISNTRCSSGGLVGPRCLGGAIMRVRVTTEQRGEATTRKVESSVVLKHSAF